MSTQLLNIINKLSTGSVSESAIAQILTILENDKIEVVTEKPKTKSVNKTKKDIPRQKKNDDTPFEIIDRIRKDTLEKYNLNLVEMLDTYIINTDDPNDKDYMTCIRKNNQNTIRKPPTKADIGKTYYTVYIRDTADDINTDHISLEIERRKFGITKTETGHVWLSLSDLRRFTIDDIPNIVKAIHTRNTPLNIHGIQCALLM